MELSRCFVLRFLCLAPGLLTTVTYSHCRSQYGNHIRFFFSEAAQKGSMTRPQGAGRLRRNFLTRPTPSCWNSSFPVCGTSQGGTRPRTKSETFPVFSLEAAQKCFATRPQAEQTPEAYLLGYVEDVCEPRTTLRAFFSSRLSRCRLVGTCRPNSDPQRPRRRGSR
jgi:hypothetical protein